MQGWFSTNPGQDNREPPLWTISSEKFYYENDMLSIVMIANAQNRAWHLKKNWKYFLVDSKIKKKNKINKDEVWFDFCDQPFIS